MSETTTTTKHLATVVLNRDELVRHVRDAAWLMAKSTADKSETPTKDDSHLIDVFQRTFQGDGNDDIATRCMNLGYYRCAHKLRELAGDNIDMPIAYSDEMRYPEAYSIELRLSEDWHKSSVHYMEELLHNLLVYMVLAQWCDLVAPEYSDKLAIALAGLEKQVDDLLSTSDTGSHRTLWPYPLG